MGEGALEVEGHLQVLYTHLEAFLVILVLLQLLYRFLKQLLDILSSVRQLHPLLCLKYLCLKIFQILLLVIQVRKLK